MQIKEDYARQYVLHKHHLLEGSQVENILQVVNDVIALHATSVGTPYLSLFARMKRFQRDQLDEEFYVKRNLIRLELMRGTLFIVSTELAPMLFQATKTSERQLAYFIRKWGINARECEELVERLCEVLKGGEKTLQEIKRSLPREIVRSVTFKAGNQVYRATNVSVVLQVLTRKGIVISEKSPGKLGITRGNRFALLKEKYPRLNLDSVGEEEAKVMLLRSYVRAFGPVTEEDVAWWTGFGRAEVRNALADIAEELVTVKICGFKGNYMMLKGDYEEFVKFKPLVKCSLVLLPYEDPYTKGYKIRNRLVDSTLEKRVYVGGGVLPTILLNGEIIGVWNRSIEEGKGPIKLNLFSSVDKNIERKLIEKAEEIGKLMANHKVDVEAENIDSH
ncbi:MAG: winged helix DNA-binding domain-containing protein [Candidatus Bathyarchaeia archaeon]